MNSFQALQLPVHRGTAAWNAILPDQAAPVVAEGAVKADFAIIGAGFAGLAAARRLMQLAPDARIVLLDAGRIGEAAAGRNSGFMIDLPHELTSDDYAGAGDDRAMIALNRMAQDFAGEAVEDYEISRDFFDPAGKINGAASETADQNNKSYAAHLTSLGESSTALDAQQMAEMTGSPHYVSGLYTPGTIMLQPAGFVRGMAAGLKRSGATVYENSPVTEMTQSGQSWLLKTPKAQVQAGKVILGANGHLGSFGFETKNLMQLFLFASMTPELTSDQRRVLGGERRWGITPSDPMGTTMRRIDTAQGGHRIVTRTCAVLRAGMKTTPADLARASDVMHDKFNQRFPQLSGLNMEYVWAGHLCLSRNGVSVTRELEQNLFSACVQNGLGTARGTLTGIAAAEMACGVGSDISDYFSKEARPKRLPPQPFQTWGGNAYLRWKERGARNE